MTYTFEGLNAQLWELVGGVDDRSLGEAVGDLHQELLKTGDHKALWELLGRFALFHVEYYCRAHPDGGAAMTRGEGVVTSITSWRDKFKTDPLKWLDIPWPVALTGVRKPLGDWTQEEYGKQWRYYDSQSMAFAERRDVWKEAGRVVGKRTTRDMADKIPEVFVQMILTGSLKPPKKKAG